MNTGKYYRKRINLRECFENLTQLIPFFFFAIFMLISSEIHAQRVVSLAPSITELLFEMKLESYLVGRTDNCNFPKETSVLPSIGSTVLNIEKILMLKPQIAFSMKTLEPVNENILTRFSIRLIHLDFSSFKNILISCKKIRNVLGKEKNTSDFEEWIEELKQPVNSKCHIYFQIWDDPMMTVSQNSFIHEIILYSGGINLFSHSSGEYPAVSREKVLSKMPSLVILCHPVSESLTDYVTRNFPILSAQKKTQFKLVNPDLFVRPGPRVVEAVNLLKTFIRGTQ